MSVQIKLTGNSMVVGIDDLQLSLGSIDQKVRYNYVENGYMEYHYAFWPNKWEFENCNPGDVFMIDEGTTLFHNENLGEKVVKIKGDPSVPKKMKQTIKMRGNADDELIFSVFSKAYTNQHDQHYAYLKIHYIDIDEENTHKFNFDENFSDWQVLTRNVIAEYPYDKVEVGVVYQGCNYALFDAIQL